jgi:ABC-type sugar transport system ATPase subunit
MSVCLECVSKRFGNIVAVDNVSFEAGSGEFFVVIGPTGCGKTTILKLIAGLIRPDSGTISFGGRNVNELPPEARGVRMVFQGQDYALWPHMKIYDEKHYTNLSFSLRIRKYLPRRIRNIVEGVSDQVGIDRESYAKKPGQLSQGQKQRIAVGRALTIPPRVFLFDEPLANLDPASRYKVMKEIMRLHKELATTTIYVTHNLIEAVAMADKMAVMKEGRILQVGTPREIRERPENDFVEEFIRYSDVSYYESAFKRSL